MHQHHNIAVHVTLTIIKVNVPFVDSGFVCYVHRVSKKLWQCYFLNNAVKHWPI